MGTKTLTSEQKGVFWGVDWSTKALSIGWTDAAGDDRGVATFSWPSRAGGAERLDEMMFALETDLPDFARRHPAVFVYLEQASGAHGAPTLNYSSGVIQLAVYRVLRNHWKGRPIQIDIVPSATWKKKVLGRGDYKKPNPKKNETFEYEAMKWCRLNGILVADDNEADASCIAEYARREVRFI